MEDLGVGKGMRGIFVAPATEITQHCNNTTRWWWGQAEAEVVVDLTSGEFQSAYLRGCYGAPPAS